MSGALVKTPSSRSAAIPCCNFATCLRIFLSWATRALNFGRSSPPQVCRLASVGLRVRYMHLEHRHADFKTSFVPRPSDAFLFLRCGQEKARTPGRASPLRCFARGLVKHPGSVLHHNLGVACHPERFRLLELLGTDFWVGLLAVALPRDIKPPVRDWGCSSRRNANLAQLARPIRLFTRLELANNRIRSVMRSRPKQVGVISDIVRHSACSADHPTFGSWPLGAPWHNAHIPPGKCRCDCSPGCLEEPRVSHSVLVRLQQRNFRLVPSSKAGGSST